MNNDSKIGKNAEWKNEEAKKQQKNTDLPKIGIVPIRFITITNCLLIFMFNGCFIEHGESLFKKGIETKPSIFQVSIQIALFCAMINKCISR